MRYLLILLGVLAPLMFSAQEIKYCGQTEQTQKLFQHFPDLQRSADDAEEQLRLEEEQFAQQRGGGDELIIIPIVFHIIHEGGNENISDAQVYSALELLNRDMRKLNPDTVSIASEFVDIAADIDIEFRLAQLDPEGNCTKGINRIQSNLTNEGGSEMKELIFWPRDMYLNVWICKDAAGAAGYTYRPGAVNNGWLADQDGIVMRHDYVGAIGTSSSSSSRTLPHEVGHWLNLSHTWGGTNEPAVADNCFSDDGVNDTPETIGWTSCSNDPVTCGSLDNIQNYMEYSYCSKMFTQGQRTRMRAAAMSGVADRNDLSTAQNLVATGVSEDPILCDADFEVNQRVVCVGDEVIFTDLTYNGASEWTWTFGDGNSVSGEDESNPTHIYSEPGLYSITLLAGNGVDDVTETKEAHIRVLGIAEKDLPFTEGFEESFSNEDWLISNPDNGDTFEWEQETANFGDNCLFLDNRNNALENNRDQLMSTTIDASEAAEVRIEYYWAYANKFDETDDRFKVYISNDCGSSWALKKQHRGLNDLPSRSPLNGTFVPDSDEWNYFNIIISDADELTDNFRVMFEFEGRGGNNFYLDDINISVISVGVEEVSLVEEVKVYPVPAVNEANVAIALSAEVSQANLEVYDAHGKLIQTIFKGNLPAGEQVWRVNTSQLSSGLYFVVFSGEGNKFSKALLVE